MDAVKIRQELQPIMVHEASWKEDQLVDAFIAGRQNARMRRSREGGSQGGGRRGESSSLLQNDFFGDGWDDDSFMSMSTSAEENEAALSDALMENFGLSLHDDYDETTDGDVNQSFSYIQNSTIGSEAGPNHLVTPSLHPLQPSSLAGSFRLGRSVDEEASWPNESSIPVNPW